MVCDSWQRLPPFIIYHVEDWLSSWRRVRAPTLMLLADDGQARSQFGPDDEEYRSRLSCFVDARVVELSKSGHNVQHDRAEGVASELAAFFLHTEGTVHGASE